MPVSSSAQLVLLPWLLGWEQPAERTTFAAALHAGSCVGIGWALRSELRRLTAREVAVLGAVSVPAAVAGLLAADAVEERLGRPPQLAALLAGFGALMWAVDARAADRAAVSAGAAGATGRGARLAVTVRAGRTVTASAESSAVTPPSAVAPPSAVTGREAALAAVAQVAALVPGVSRAGATLTALRAAGVERAAAERFSLLMSLPVTAGAAGLTLVRADRAALRELGPALASGAATATVMSAVAVRRLAARPGRPLAGAALYRLGLAAAVAARLVRKGDL